MARDVSLVGPESSTSRILAANDHDGLFYVHAPALDLASSAGLRDLREFARRHELDLLVIDSFRRATPGLDENDSAAVSGVMSPLRDMSARSGLTVVVIHHPRKRGENLTEVSQMVRGSIDFVASVDTLLYAPAKETGEFTLEQAKSRRGLPHETILVRIEDTDDRLKLTNASLAARAEDKVEAMLGRVVAELRSNRNHLERQTLARRIGSDTKDGTFNRALKLGCQRNQLIKNSQGVGKPTIYALTETPC